MSKHQALRNMEALEEVAYQALLDDPAVKADINAEHTPALLKAWHEACEVCRSYRAEHGLLGLDWKEIEAGVVKY